jgi:glutamate racemase
MSKHPIVVFDSGVGGISILKEIIHSLPYENIVYLADSKNAPYGLRTRQDIIDLSIKNTELAIQMKAKTIVVACNTATTNAISFLRSHYALPFIGIEPAIKPAAINSKAKRIGVLATKGTLSSDLFKHTSKRFTEGVNVVEVIGKGIVEAVEGGWTNDETFISHLNRQIQPFIKEDIDYLVLGCTHFPYIIPKLRELLPKHVIIIDSGRAVAKQTKSVLKGQHLKNTGDNSGDIKIYTNTNNSSTLQELMKNFKDISITHMDF